MPSKVLELVVPAFALYKNLTFKLYLSNLSLYERRNGGNNGTGKNGTGITTYVEKKVPLEL